MERVLWRRHIELEMIVMLLSENFKQSVKIVRD